MNIQDVPRLDELAASIRARAAEIEAARRLPPDIAAALADAGVFRSMVPRSLGGLELPPADCLALFEHLGRADASTGWCAMIGATAALPAAYLEPEAARRIFGAPGTIVGGVFAPMGRATLDGDHYRLTGRWAWGSGSANCHWLSGGALICGGDGQPIIADDGQPAQRMMFFPASSARLLDTWHVGGLQGTGSGDFEVAELSVPAGLTVVLTSERPRELGPLYRFPLFGLLAAGIAAVMLGNARGAVDDLVALAQSRRTAGSGRTLAEREGAQSTLAESEAHLRAARALLSDAVASAWSRAQSGQDLTIDDRAGLRLAATFAARTSADVTRAMFDLGGGAALYTSSPLQRRFRDAHAGCQHMMIAAPTYALAGRVLMGVPTDARLL